ncbi:MAG: hypothetical protein HON43_01690 [Alphaproteobacteria bacterium]|nr:hypothetical protein [Alphaproteobacteria bacterium]MBT5390623.1 hypothetical protein [Alphaproteobacteria bacterium]MBT5540783.1 hypothetical protein [Alphaproteobacteria bacterium]
MKEDSELVIGGIGFPEFSARGCVQKLIPLETGRYFRTINGKLRYAGQQERKYRTVITCQDKTVPDFHSVKSDQEFQVQCISRLWQRVPREAERDGDSIVCSLKRDPVPGSPLVHQGGKIIIPINVSEKNVSIPIISGNVFITYRPLLRMHLINFETTYHEWDLTWGWKMLLDEV